MIHVKFNFFLPVISLKLIIIFNVSNLDLMKSSFKNLSLLFLLLLFNSGLLVAQCPASKYGINPVWPVNWTETDKQDWYYEMSSRGQGFLSDGETWRYLQEIADSNELALLKNEVLWAKTNGGINKYLFQFKNPIQVANHMPPIWCGNPLTDTNTTNSMFEFITVFLDSMHQVLDYFVLGNQADLYFKNKPQETDAYFSLARRVDNYITLNYPEIKFGVGISVYCPQNPDTYFWDNAFDIGDIISVSWWPLNSVYMTDSVEIESIDATVSSLINKSNGKPIVISDCGATSAIIDPRGDLQTEFVKNIFSTTMNVPQIEAVGYYYLADFDSLSIYYYQNQFLTYAPTFYQSIKSRGLLDSLGNPKEAYNMYLSMLDTVCAHAGIIDNDFNLDVKIWPNPADDEIFINGTNIESYKIFSTSGQLVAQSSVGKYSECRIDISYLNNGVYIMQVVSKNELSKNLLFVKKDSQ